MSYIPCSCSMQRPKAGTVSRLITVVKRKADEGRLKQARTESKKPRRNSAKHKAPCLKVFKNTNQRQC